MVRRTVPVAFIGIAHASSSLPPAIRAFGGRLQRESRVAGSEGDRSPRSPGRRLESRDRPSSRRALPGVFAASLAPRADELAEARAHPGDQRRSVDLPAEPRPRRIVEDRAADGEAATRGARARLAESRRELFER